jgi:hypothetical protein
MVLVQKLMTSALFGISTVFIIPRLPPSLITGNLMKLAQLLMTHTVLSACHQRSFSAASCVERDTRVLHFSQVSVDLNGISLKSMCEVAHEGF